MTDHLLTTADDENRPHTNAKWTQTARRDARVTQLADRLVSVRSEIVYQRTYELDELPLASQRASKVLDHQVPQPRAEHWSVRIDRAEHVVIEGQRYYAIATAKARHTSKPLLYLVTHAWP